MTANLPAAIFLLLLLAGHASGQSYQWQQKASGMGLGNPLTFNPSNENTLYASVGGAGAVYVSRDRGSSWEILATVPGGGSLKSICVDPADSLLILVGQERSSFPDRVLKSTDGGSAWTETLSGEFSYYGVPVEFNPHHPDTVFTMMGNTVYRSIDFGSTWVLMSRQTSFNTWCDAALRPDSASVMYVGDNTSGIWKTADGGVSFRHVYATEGEIPMISIDEHDPSVAYATKFFGAGSGVIKTTDYGESWFELGAFQNYTQCWGIAIDRSDHDRIVMGTYTSDLARSGVYLSGDGGANWVRTTCGLNRPVSQNYGLLVLDSLTVIALQDEGLYALRRIELSTYPRGFLAGVLRDSLTQQPLAGTVRLTQTRCDSMKVFVQEAGASGVFSFDNLLVTDDLLSASYKLAVDPELPYGQRVVASIHVDAGGTFISVGLKRADVFIVGEDSGSHETYYEDALSSLGLEHYFWNTLSRGPAPMERGAEFGEKLVVYFTAGKVSPLGQQAESSLMACLDAGCNLLITGQDLLERNPSADIFSTQLGIRFLGNASILYNEGAPGDILAGVSFFTNSGGADYPQSRDIISISNPNVKPILGYGPGGSLGVAGVRRESVRGNGRVVFLGFGFETINPREKRLAVMERLMQYFSSSLDVDAGDILHPQSPLLSQNYPNPFNPTTTLEVVISEGQHVQLSVTDLLGREVKRLIDEPLPPGTHSRIWNAEEAPSGLYFARLTTRTMTRIRKLLLVR